MLEDFNGSPCVSDTTFFRFFELLHERYDIPKNWYLKNSRNEETEWFNDFVDSLYKAVYFDGYYQPGSIYDSYFNMKLPKSEIYMVWYEVFNNTLTELGMDESEFVGDMDSTGDFLFREAPWETFSYSRLKETNDYFWFLVLFIQKFGSTTQYTADDVKRVLINLYDKGYTKKFDFDWFKPFEVWMTSNYMMKDFYNRKFSLKSLGLDDFSKLDFSEIQPDAITDIPEYEINETYFNINDNYYHVDKVLLAISASGGLAQALERQDLEPKVTTVSSLLNKKKKRGRK
jgi:hypothetical protein